jgi:hypothetical protein
MEKELMEMGERGMGKGGDNEEKRERGKGGLT